MEHFLSNRSQLVIVDGCLIKLVIAVSGVPQGGVMGPSLFLLCTPELVPILRNKLVGYADNSTLMAVVPSITIKVTIAQFLNRDPGKVNE